MRLMEENSTIVGGSNNDIEAQEAFIGGGVDHSIFSGGGVIAGGDSNAVRGTLGFVGGGTLNVSGGRGKRRWWRGRKQRRSGFFHGRRGETPTKRMRNLQPLEVEQKISQALLDLRFPGGQSNEASGEFSFAAGFQAKAMHSGAFVFADSTSGDFESTGSNEFSVRCSGGARFVTGAGETPTGVVLAPGGSMWQSLSDRNAKENIESVNPREVLERLASIPVSVWNYKSQDASERHMGPMAQDFYAAFGLGNGDTRIGTVDADGVALASIQGLYQVLLEQAELLRELKEENALLQIRLDVLEQEKARRLEK